MPRTEYKDLVAEKQFQEARSSLGEQLDREYNQQDGESIMDYDRRRSTLESYQSGDYAADERGNYSYKPSKMRR